MPDAEGHRRHRDAGGEGRLVAKDFYERALGLEPSESEQPGIHGRVWFEHYDLPGLTLEGDVHVAEGFKGAWFKDPDGNILHVNGR